MKKFKNLKFIYFLILLIFLSSCNKDLSRENAKELILSKCQYPLYKWISFPSEENAGLEVVVEDPNNNTTTIENEPFDKPEWLASLEKEGLIKLSLSKEKKLVEEDRSWYWNPKPRIRSTFVCKWVVNFTDEGMKYTAEDTDDVIAATYQFNEIIGIIKVDDTHSKVDFAVWKKDITPFGRLRNITEELINRSVIIENYDDGWRINEILCE
ncbi:MAG: hypothetical protein IPM34_02075 [Saprospiraceae bacterium]|nr:hypothetical protein [Saprospiraceae bacterium]